MPIESVPPFAIIVAAITAMGGIQYWVHVAYEGRPKASMDKFDRRMRVRDDRLHVEAQAKSPVPIKSLYYHGPWHM